MKRFCFVVVSFVFVWAESAWSLRVVATTPDLAAIARAVGGERVVVSSLLLGVQDPHKIEAKPSYIRDLSRADLLLYNGLELEIGWLPLLIEGARNPNVRVGSLGNLDASRGVPVLEKPLTAVDRSQGDVHPEGNPHYLLDPRNGKIVARSIAERFAQLDPAHRADYEQYLTVFLREMDRRIAEWERRLAVVKGIPLVAYHKTWEYLAAWAGFRIVAYVEEKPGIPGSPRYIASVMRRIQEEKALAIIAAVYNPVKECENLARRAGIPSVTLPAAVGAEKTITTYPELFDALVARLEKIAQGGRL